MGIPQQLQHPCPTVQIDDQVGQQRDRDVPGQSMLREELVPDCFPDACRKVLLEQRDKPLARTYIRCQECVLQLEFRVGEQYGKLWPNERRLSLLLPLQDLFGSRKKLQPPIEQPRALQCSQRVSEGLRTITDAVLVQAHRQALPVAVPQYTRSDVVACFLQQPVSVLRFDHAGFDC